MTDFYNNLISLTNNLEDIAFTKYATITNINSDGTCTAKEDEEEGLTHENINPLGNNLQVGDKVVLGFVDNSIYNPVILTGGEEAYTKTETDTLLQNKINEPSAEGTNGQVLGEQYKAGVLVLILLQVGEILQVILKCHRRSWQRILLMVRQM